MWLPSLLRLINGLAISLCPELQMSPDLIFKEVLSSKVSADGVYLDYIEQNAKKTNQKKKKSKCLFCKCSQSICVRLIVGPDK